ncbi:uncharacterized protein NECHADRAFT_40529 [Fusarium vanettenii 77-13-4]|uniref:Zn(2)-C6 fungal-type domain-containing protein n=1 Tax=Fusarium vanettenii (strain ATCC MYA-4622 / CBS 123669 / FGSC 9596 / NRRL 45880 / 77-13-4) TaxID=660122 RepID=C7YSQ8_FUSV7|nr:uncharacterized protein NECHADRAFT_40529 [Fusarium vanettenii 77-13-4]EEU45285.1 hypothetical protein NECHADRAFT_40529 [Fusarium vanettenii 77-13-4]
MSESAENPSPLPRRTRVACKACHARRVKCDAGDGQPCWHCRTRNTTCELIESRRGKYTRQSRGQPKDRRVSRRLRETREPSTDVVQSSPDIALNTPNSISSPNGQDAPQPQDEDTSAGFPQPNVSQQTQTQTNARSYCLGDSNSLSYIIEMICSPRGGVAEPVKVHYPIPASIADRAVLPNRPQVEVTSLQDALIMPPRNISDRLISSFFNIMHPAFPVVNRRVFIEQYKLGQASPLLLQAVFLIAVTLCDDNLIQDAGFLDRATARKTYYLRAKTLYDVDHETDRSNIASALSLMGFWWNGPDDQKDSWYCMARSELSQETRSLWRRIWWSIYSRDRHTAACLGRPCRIRDEDCDIELLTEDDLRFDECYDEELIPSQKDHHISYFIEMSNLAVILGDIVIGEFSPRRPALECYKAKNLVERLEQWHSKLPECLREMPPDESLGASFWASNLQMAYQNYYILLFRPKVIENLSPEETERDVRARMAADSITRMAEDMLASGTIRYGQMHLVPAVFGALSIHTIVICRKDPIRRQLAGNKSRQCILALSELAKPWPVGLWIMRFFVNLFRRLTGQDSAVPGGAIVNVTSRIGNSDVDSRGSQPTDNVPIPTRSEGTEPAIPAVANNRAQSQDQHAVDFMPQVSDPLGYDSFWAGCLDNSIDVDLLLQHGLGPLLPAPFGVAPPDTMGL